MVKNAAIKRYRKSDPPRRTELQTQLMLANKLNIA